MSANKHAPEPGGANEQSGHDEGRPAEGVRAVHEGALHRGDACVVQRVAQPRPQNRRSGRSSVICGT